MSKHLKFSCFGMVSLLFGYGLWGNERVVYHETFPPYRDAHRYIRIARACESWAVEKAEPVDFIRIHVVPSAKHSKALVVWDLAAIRFHRLRFRLKAFGVDVDGLTHDISLQDQQGRFFTVAAELSAPDEAGWRVWHADISIDTVKVFEKGKEVSPFVYGRGEEKTQFDHIDFDNIGFTKIFINIGGIENTAYDIGIQGLQLSVIEPKG